MYKELSLKLLIKLAQQIEEIAPSGPDGVVYHLILHYEEKGVCSKCGKEGGFALLELKPPSSYYYDDIEDHVKIKIYCEKCLSKVKIVEKEIWKEQMTFVKIKDAKGDWVGTATKCWECGQVDFIYHDD
jgi:hypothetical protein